MHCAKLSLAPSMGGVGAGALRRRRPRPHAPRHLPRIVGAPPRLGARLRNHVRSNAYGLLAVFIAIGGTAYATSQLPKNSVGTKQLRKNAVTGAKVKDKTLTGADINLAKLGRVPSAKNAAH